MILPNRLDQCFGHFLPRHWDFQANRPRRIPKSVEVFLEAEHTAVVKSDAFEDSVAIKKSMVKDGDLRIRFRVEFSVDVNLRFPDAGRRSRPTFYCRFDRFFGRALVSLWFFQHRRIIGFHVSNKTSNVWTRNSNRNRSEERRV